MPDPPDIICPHCGCRGHKAPHKKLSWIHSREEAEQFGWNDLACGSCGRAFQSFPWPPRRER
jgi:hypothetical protein